MTIQERAAEILGWTVEAVSSFSLQAIRTLVNPCGKRGAELARDIDSEVRSGRIVLPPRHE